MLTRSVSQSARTSSTISVSPVGLGGNVPIEFSVEVILRDTSLMQRASYL
jgi:hypothetical protein